MQINLQSIDRESFMVHEHVVKDMKMYLVQPVHIGCKWTRENMIFRSSVWDENGNPVSLSWKKFVNWGEKPDVFPVPTSLVGCVLPEKLDGSCLICTYIPSIDYVMYRTRGTVDATTLNNGHEIAILKEKYPKLEDSIRANPGKSFIFEWVSSENVIVIKYPDTPDIYLTGVINHVDYSYSRQSELDAYAKDCGFKRPRVYAFDSIEQMQKEVENFQNIEGLCVYHKDGQEIHKIKGAQYLACHRFKANANIETVVDLFFQLDTPQYNLFETALIEKFDYECYSMVRGFVSQVCDAWKEVQHIVMGFHAFDLKTRHLTQKDAALKILQAYGDTNRSAMLFSIRSGKPLSIEQLKKLLYQCLKK